MSKSDDAQEAVRDVKEQVFQTGIPAVELISSIAPEYGLATKVVESWLLREYPTLDALDSWGAIERNAIIDREVRRQERSQQEQQRFSGLAQIIDVIPHKALWFASLNVVGNGWSAAWRQWIKENCSDPEIEQAAFIFARSRIKARLATTAGSET